MPYRGVGMLEGHGSRTGFSEGSAVSDAWMPGIRYVRAAADGGPLKGGAPRVVWHALGADPQRVSARSAAQRLDQDGHPSHLVWNPCNGEIVQLIPIVRAACPVTSESGDAGMAGSTGPGGLAAAGPWGGSGGAAAEVPAEGRVCVQISVVAMARDPFTGGPMKGRREIMTWLDSWGVPRCWPAGRPAPFPECHASERSRRLWARGGHFGASQVPGLTAAGGPGAIDPECLTGWPTPAGAPDIGELLGTHAAHAALPASLAPAR
jgi:hypothetical protein